MKFFPVSSNSHTASSTFDSFELPRRGAIRISRDSVATTEFLSFGLGGADPNFSAAYIIVGYDRPRYFNIPDGATHYHFLTSAGNIEVNVSFSVSPSDEFKTFPLVYDSVYGVSNPAVTGPIGSPYSGEVLITRKQSSDRLFFNPSQVASSSDAEIIGDTYFILKGDSYSMYAANTTPSFQGRTPT